MKLRFALIYEEHIQGNLKSVADSLDCIDLQLAASALSHLNG